MKKANADTSGRPGCLTIYERLNTRKPAPVRNPNKIVALIAELSQATTRYSRLISTREQKYYDSPFSEMIQNEGGNVGDAA